MDLLQVREELRENFDNLYNTAIPALPTRLWHYTSPEGFEGIIKTKSFWCTDIRTVNDPREGDHGAEILKRIIHRKSIPGQFRDAALRSPTLFGLKDLFHSYVASFTSMPGQRHMWTSYARNGEGCAIAFSYTKLKEGEGNEKSYTLIPIIYDRGKQADMMEQIIDHAIRTQREWNIPSHLAVDYWAKEVILSLLSCGVLFKEEKWQLEQEYRIMVMGGDDDEPIMCAGRPRLIRTFDSTAVVEVERGPKASNDLSTEKIRRILAEHDYPEGIPITDAPPE